MYTLLSFLFSLAHAAAPIPQPGLINPLGSGTTTCALLAKVAEGAILIGGALSGVMIFIGAFQFLFSGGDPKRVEMGKKTILYTVIGYVILIASSAITYLVADLLGGTPSSC